MCHFLHARRAAYLATVSALAVLFASTLPNHAFCQFTPLFSYEPTQDPHIATNVDGAGGAIAGKFGATDVERQESRSVEEQLAAIRTELDAFRKERDEEIKKAVKKKEE
jgi:hypothetical protein